MMDIDAAIRELRSLSRGWDHGSGIAIKEPVLDALARLLIAGQHLAPQVFPADDGGAAISFSLGDEDFLEVEVNADGTFCASLERGIGPEYDVIWEKENLDEAAALRMIPPP